MVVLILFLTLLNLLDFTFLLPYIFLHHLKMLDLHVLIQTSLTSIALTTIRHSTFMKSTHFSSCSSMSLAFINRLALIILILLLLQLVDLFLKLFSLSDDLFHLDYDGYVLVRWGQCWRGRDGSSHCNSWWFGVLEELQWRRNLKSLWGDCRPRAVFELYFR